MGNEITAAKAYYGDHKYVVIGGLAGVLVLIVSFLQLRKTGQPLAVTVTAPAVGGTGGSGGSGAVPGFGVADIAGAYGAGSAASVAGAAPAVALGQAGIDLAGRALEAESATLMAIGGSQAQMGGSITDLFSTILSPVPLPVPVRSGPVLPPVTQPIGIVPVHPVQPIPPVPVKPPVVAPKPTPVPVKPPVVAPKPVLPVHPVQAPPPAPKPTPVPVKPPVVAPKPVPVPVKPTPPPAPKPVPVPVKPRLYKIMHGNTLGKIAALYKTTPSRIQAATNAQVGKIAGVRAITNINDIYAGYYLVIA